MHYGLPTFSLHLTHMAGFYVLCEVLYKNWQLFFAGCVFVFQYARVGISAIHFLVSCGRVVDPAPFSLDFIRATLRNESR